MSNLMIYKKGVTIKQYVEVEDTKTQDNYDDFETEYLNEEQEQKTSTR